MTPVQNFYSCKKKKRMIMTLHSGFYTSRRIKNPPQCRSVKEVEADKKGSKSMESMTGLLGMEFPPSPGARSSSAGVLCKDRDKGKPDGDGYCNDARNPPPGGKGAGSRPNGARMAWLQWPAAWQTASVSNHGNKADPHLRENSVPMEPNN